MRGVFDSVAGQLRPDERPHVGGPASAVEALRRQRHRRARRDARARPRRRHRRSRAPVRRSRRPGRRGRAHRHQRRDARRRPRPAARRGPRRSPCVQCDAEKLPFPGGRFDCVSIAFGLRNVTRKEAALAEMRRVLKPGGVAAVLEFSQVWAPLAPAYDWYSFNVLPRLGRLVAGDDASYRYLAESIRMHPDQATLKRDDGTSGLRPGRSPQPDGRRRRPAPGLRLLTPAHLRSTTR